MKICQSCQRSVESLRKGMCDTCYYQDYNAKNKESYCECCGWSDLRALVRRRLDRENWSTLCGNCATIAGRRVMTLDKLRSEVIPDGDRRQRDRRNGSDRRNLGKTRREREDQRLLTRDTPERRGDDRREK